MSIEIETEHPTSGTQNRSQEALPLHSKARLIVTTAKGIYSWNSRGSTELFSSKSEGIASARTLESSKDLLAIADSQVVVLHDLNTDTPRTYRLKNQDHGKVRKLIYHPGKERLFFTTTLQNAVQTFSLGKCELLDAGPVHVSPPIAFAVSPSCDLLVSASDNPRIIYLSRIAYKQPPLLFIPNCSNASVAAVAFHPTRSNVFALAFQDGTIAAYNATVLPSDSGIEERYSYARIHGEIAHLKHVHNVLDECSEMVPADFSHDYPTVTALQFLADQPCSIVSIGADGNCSITQFEKDGDKSCQIVQQWNMKAPATSLAILKTGQQFNIGQIDGTLDEPKLGQTNPVLLAIGTSDATVRVYDRTGNLLAMKNFKEHGQILDLEWTKNPPEAIIPQNKSPSRVPSRTASVPELTTQRDRPLRNSRSSIGSKILVKLHTKDQPPDDYLMQTVRSIEDIAEETNEKPPGVSQVDPAQPIQPPRELPTIHTFDLPSTTDTQLDDTFHNKEDPPGSDAQSDEIADVTNLDAQEPFQQKEENLPASAIGRDVELQSSRSFNKKVNVPVIPIRPVPRPGGKLALRRMESAKARRSSIVVPAPVPKEVATAVATGQSPFKAVNHGSNLRPRIFRHRSSRVSPFTEVPIPTPLASNHAMHITASKPLLSPLSQTTPVQYDRRNRNSSATESSLGYSQASFLSVPSKPLATPPKSKPIDTEVVRLGSVRQGKLVQIESSPAVTSYSSDSGASYASVLVWTPGTDTRARALAPSIEHNLKLIPLNLPSQHEVHNIRSSNERKGDPASGTTSSASLLDWSGTQQFLPKVNSDTVPVEQTINKDEFSGGAGQRDSGQESKTGDHLADKAPSQLRIPKLRRQETVINLKRRKTDSIPTHASDPSADKTQAKEVVIDVQPRLSDTVLLEKDTKARGIPEDNTIRSKISSVAFSKRHEDVTPSRRPSSHSRSMFDLRQSRHGSTVGSQSTYTIEDVIRVECAALATRIDVAFAEQKGWLQGFLRDQNWYVQRLEEENRRFREELARMRRSKD